MPQKLPLGGATNNGVGEVVDNLTPKPTTLTFRAGEVSMQKGGDSINYTYSPSENAKSTYAVAYEYCFGNTMDNPMALDLQTINTSSVNLSYVYSPTKLDLTQGVTSNTQYKLQTIPNKNDNLYVYILVSPVEGSSTVNFDSKVTWYLGIAKTITIENNINGTTTTQTIISGKEVEKDKLETPTAPTGYYFDAWYRDRNYESLVEDTVTTSSKLYARYANLPTDWLELDTTTDTYYVKRGTTALTNITSLTIPSMHNGKKITYIASAEAIEEGVFYQQTSLNSVALPATLINLGAFSFSNSSLTDINIPKGVNELPKEVFRGCRFTSFIVPNNITVIDFRAFGYCINLTNVVLDCYLEDTYLRNSVFYNCTSLKEILIPEGITSIGNNCFQFCSSLEKIIFPTTLTYIGRYTFVQCTSLEYIDLSRCNNFIQFGEYCFQRCSNLVSVILPQSLKYIETSAFAYCIQLTHFNIEDTDLHYVAGLAFYCCYGLTKFTLKSSTYSIGDKAFADCCNLVEVWDFSSSFEVICGSSDVGGLGYYAEKVYTTECKSELVAINNVVYSKLSDTSYKAIRPVDKTVPNIKFYRYTTYIRKHAFYGAYGDSSFTSFDFSSCVNLKSIGEYAFYNNNAITNIDLGVCKNLIDIRYGAFANCTNLQTIQLCEGIIILESQAFANCNNVTTITLPSTINRMGGNVFIGCTNLTSLTIDTSLTWYKTQNHTDFSNRINGTQISLGTPSENANNFVNNSDYLDYYWYNK